MARGFESKDVEYQQAEAQRQTTGLRSDTPDAREARDRQLSLELSLSRAEADFASARSPAHRHMLEQAIAELRGRLSRS